MFFAAIGTALSAPPPDVGHAGFKPAADGAMHYVCTEDAFALETGPLAVFGVARIDNRAELIAALKLGAQDDMSDPQLIAAAWTAWGEDAPKRLIGDFAFVLRDDARGVLFSARDPSGTVPLWYAAHRGGMLFASAPGLIIDTPDFENAPDEHAVAAHILNADTGTRRTLTQGLFRLNPSTSICIPTASLATSGPGIEPVTWWRPEDIRVDTSLTLDEVATRLVDLFEQAVHARIPADDKVGVHASGGLDSTTVCILTARRLAALGRPAPEGYSWQATPDPDDISLEHKRILATGRIGGFNVNFLPGTQETIAFSQRLDPFRFSSNMVQLELPVMRAAQQAGVRTILSGWGGDEVATFNGRGLYLHLFKTLRWLPLLRIAAQSDRSAARFVVKHCLLPALRQMRSGLRGSDATEAQRLAANEVALNPEFRARVNVEPPMPFPTDPKKMQHRLMSQGHISDRIESWALIGQLHGLRYVYPMLDRRLLEFALSIPVELFRTAQWNRMPARLALDAIGGAEIAWTDVKDEPERSKQSQGQGLISRDKINAYLMSGAPLRYAEWIDHDALREAAAQHEAGKNSNAHDTIKSLKPFIIATQMVLPEDADFG